MEKESIWNDVLNEIETSVSKANFNTWFKDTCISKIDSGIVFLSVPNTFVQEWLNKKFHSMILKNLRNNSSNIHSLKYVILKEDDKKQNNNKESFSGVGIKINRELPLNDYYINKEDNLNPRYTFDNFIIGPFNQLAFAASQAVIKRPGFSYNPLFIYGNTGHGKTHLIQAIGNKIKSDFKEKKVYYLTSEKFTVDYFDYLQNGKMNIFKEKYRKYDVLIMDDIQFFSNKEKTQEELFHLFNSLYENNRQIIFSSDKHPHYIQNLEDRLKSRFSAGMIVDIPSPDNESRAAILKSKALANNVPINESIIDFLSENIPGNIRDLEGIINSIACQTEIKKEPLNLNEIKNLIKHTQKPKKIVSHKEIIKVVADFYKIDERSVYEKTRRKEVIKPRQVVMYILRCDFNMSYPSIGEKIGGRDHTTVIHSYEKIKRDLKEDNVLLQELNQIRSIIM